jgi:hypothetical protein
MGGSKDGGSPIYAPGGPCNVRCRASNGGNFCHKMGHWPPRMPTCVARVAATHSSETRVLARSGTYGRRIIHLVSESARLCGPCTGRPSHFLPSSHSPDYGSGRCGPNCYCGFDVRCRMVGRVGRGLGDDGQQPRQHADGVVAHPDTCFHERIMAAVDTEHLAAQPGDFLHSGLASWTDSSF